MLFSLLVTVILTGCSTIQIPQRAYIDPYYLDGAPADVTADVDQKDKRSQIEKISRVLDMDGTTLLIYPMTKSFLNETFDKVAYKENIGGEEKTKFVSKEMEKFKGHTCFWVDVTSSSREYSQLKYLYLTLVTDNGKKIKLTPIIPPTDPKETSRVGSYSLGGYSIGNYYVPSTTNVYSYTIYSNDSVYCAKSEVSLAAGFTLYADPRFKEGQPIYDLVWSTNPDSKEMFRHYPGLPNYRDFSGRWLEDRYKQNRRIVESAAE